MLTIMPEKDAAISGPALSKCAAKGPDAAMLCARGGEVLLGYVAVDIQSRELRILDFVLTGQPRWDELGEEERQLADSMIKAAASYGMNRNVFVAVSTLEPIFPLLKQFGFQQIDNKMTIDFTQLIRKCKNC